MLLELKVRDFGISVIESVEGESRLKEIAAMLAGPHVTDNSVKSAKELIRMADKRKTVSYGRD